MAASEADVAAQLIERLLADQQFRASFRRDPAQACRDAGLDELAQEMSLGAGKAMMTLDVRESKSSLAGVMMAAAMEGVGLYEFSKNVMPHLEDVPGAVGDVLSRVNLPSVGGALAASPPPSAAAPPEAPAEEAPAAASSAVAAAPVAPPEAPPEAAGGSSAAGSKPAKEVVPPEQAAAQKIAAAASPEAEQEKAAADAVAKIAEESEDLPDANDFPDGPVAPQAAAEVGPGGKPAEEEEHDHEGHDHEAHAQAPPAPVVPPEAAPPTAPAPTEPAPAPTDPAPADAPAGGGGDAAKALLEHPNLELPPGAQQDLRDGVVDPRMVAVLGELAQDHKIGLSVIKTGHDQFTSGGSVSNHFVGRGIDIATVDGEPVNPDNAAARELATAIAELDGDLRPTEVGTPWSIGADGFFTDGAHQDHLHVAFDGEPPAGFEAPSAPQPAAAEQSAAAATAPPVQPAPPGAPERDAGDSIVLAAVTAKEAAAAKAAGGAGAKPGDSLAFLRAVEPAPGPPAEAPAADAAAGAAQAGTVTGPGAYPGDDAPREQLAAWMAAEAQKRGLPPELPVMAALVESNLENVNYGHADSVGFFQMRVGIWNQGEYAGYPEDPQKQIDWFLDTAEQVKNQRKAAGLPLDDPDQYGEWIADVERPAEEYRYRYQTKLAEAEGLLKDAREAPAPAPTEPAPAPAAPTEPAGTPAGSSKPIDPEQFGAEGTGTGGEPDAAAQALLKNDKVILDEVGVADLKAGRIDPRIVAVLTKLSEDHEITVSCMCSDHSKFTSGGSVSNHHFGRGLDIAAVDGVPVNAANFDAREIAMELQEFDEEIRPNEIGTPWAISGDGYFTDAGHQDHLHVGFKQAIAPDWKPPAELAQAAAQTPVAPGTAPPVQPGAPPAPPERKAGDSLVLAAVTAQKEAAQEAAAAAAGGGAGAKVGDSLAFLRAVGSREQPAGPASALAAHAPAPDPGADAAGVTAAGGSRLGASALDVAKGELGVREEGTNTGADVDKYLAAAGVPPGSPWCASFVTWALGESGHKMEGGGWAAVQTWVRNAEQGNNDLEIVSAEDARPGDMVAYDWGGQDDFGADGHIGFLASDVKDGSFTALEGNWQDAVLKVPRQLGSDGTNMKFIRIKGDDAPSLAPSGGDAAAGGARPAPTPPADPGATAPPADPGATAPPADPGATAPPADPGATAPPADPGAAGTVLPPEAATAAAGEQQAAAAGEAAEPRRDDSLVFAAVKPQAQEAARVRATLQFLKAIDPAQAKAAGSTPVVPPELSTPSAPEPAGPAPDLSGVGDYPGDDAGQAELSKWLAKEAEKAGLPPELPVMAALVESGVQNLNHGHADSVGFFQMRVGIWNQGEYAGYPERPELQAKWFIDTALEVKKQRIAAGDVDFGKDPAKWGEWIADVERPAEEYRGRYQLRLSEARDLLG